MSDAEQETESAERLLAGDPEQIDAARGWIRAATGRYRSLLGADAEDLEQEVLLDLMVSLREGRFRGGSTLRTYVHAFTHHRCVDRVRAAKRRTWVDVEDLELEHDAPSPYDDAARDQRLRVALKVFEAMPESCRELWRMIEAGYSYRQMSRRLGASEGSLRARVLRCRRRALELRGELTDHEADGDGDEAGSSEQPR